MLSRLSTCSWICILRNVCKFTGYIKTVWRLPSNLDHPSWIIVLVCHVSSKGESRKFLRNEPPTGFMMSVIFAYFYFWRGTLGETRQTIRKRTAKRTVVNNYANKKSRKDSLKNSVTPFYYAQGSAKRLLSTTKDKIINFLNYKTTRSGLEVIKTKKLPRNWKNQKNKKFWKIKRILKWKLLDFWH